MSGIDTGILIEWINVFGQDSERELQLTGLEQLCQMLSMFDNIDKCLENFPPKTFIPVLCNIFLDDTAPELILEPTTRALYFFLDISLDCGKKITSVSGTITKFIQIIEFANIYIKESLDLGEQCVKILDLLSRGDSKAVFDAGGLPCVLKLTTLGTALHKDALYSSISAAIHLCPRVDPDYQHLPFVCLHITQLMESDDRKIFDGCLKCFTVLIKRFVSKKADLTPLIEHGLLERLLEKFDQNTRHSRPKVSSSPSTIAYSGVIIGEPVAIILPVFGLLCRGSQSITETLLSSKLPEKLKITLQSDERYVVEGLRLIEVLEILALEGREALAKSHLSSTAVLSDMFMRGESPDSPIRHIVDVLKNQDSSALISAVEKGFDVNYINEIGQSLLNWATAVGSEKQVKYLLNQGADPCLGQKFSSLHLAVMTKKPNLVKVLLKYGANPEQRAEDGSTPLEKALLIAGDGSKEGRMLVEILENAEDYMDGGSSEESDTNTEQTPAPSSPETKPRSNSAGSDTVKHTFTGDPTLAAQFVITYIPILCQAYHSTLSRTVKKMTLDLIRRLLKTPPPDLLRELSCIELSCGGCLPNVLSELLSKSLAPEEYIESHLISLQMIQFSIAKCPAIYKDSFTSLGIVEMIKEMVKIPPEQPAVIPDASKIESRKPYHWNCWCLMVLREEILYIWNQFCVLELNFMSNGWLKFSLDGKPKLLYSSGTIQPDKRKPSFLHIMKMCRETIGVSAGSLPLLSSPDSPEISAGRWTLSCPQQGVLNISNSQRINQLLVLREQGSDGFVFHYNNNSQTFNGTPMLDLLTITWNRKSKPKSDGSDKIAAIAEKIVEIHFFDSTSIARESTLELQALAFKLKTACETHDNSSSFDSDDVLKAVEILLNNLVTIISNDTNLTAYELHFSRVVDALLACLVSVGNYNSNRVGDRINLFKSTFGISTSNQKDKSKNLSLLVQKLVSVLETIEKLPVHLFDHRQTFSISNLQRKFHIELRRDPTETVLRDYTGKHFRVEPLISVGQLEKYLYTKLTKMWYDYDRNEQDFIKMAKSQPIQFNYTEDFDKNGLFYWMGTNAGTCEYSNPYDILLLNLTSSDGMYPASGFLSDFLSRDTTPKKSHIGNKKDAWLMFDIGLWFIPSFYSLRHAAGFENSGLRQWRFEGSKNGRKWQLLSNHENDTSLLQPGSTCSWPVKAPEDETEGWRYFRIKITGPDASGKYFYICISGIELYGILTGVASKPKTYQHEQILNKKRQLIQQLILPQMKQGSRVRKGLDFNWEEELTDLGTATGDLSSDGRTGFNSIAPPSQMLGYPVGNLWNMLFQRYLKNSDSRVAPCWIEVKWDNGDTNSYRMGAEGKYDLYLENLPKIPDEPEEEPPTDINSVLSDQASLIFFELSQSNEDDSENDTSSEGMQSIPEFPQGIELRGEYSDLLPPYDPRPGQYNIPVMQQLTLPDTGTPEPKQTGDEKAITGRVALWLKLTKIKIEKKDEVVIALDDPTRSLFYYLNKVFTCSEMKKYAKPWDATYELIYKIYAEKPDELDSIDSLSGIPEHNSSTNDTDNFNRFIQVLNLLSQIRELYSEDSTTPQIPQEEYHSKKVTNKILMQIRDPLTLASDALPDWIVQVLRNFSFVIPFECRMKYFKSSSFGPTRSVVWLQERHKDELDRNRSNLNVTTSRAEEHHEFRLGRLRVDVVTVSRNLTLQQARRIMDVTCSRKAILEIQYENEEGTGLGPSLEFYSLVAAELQKVELNMWLNDTWEITNEERYYTESDIESRTDEQESSSKYVHCASGLFPVPYPLVCETGTRVTELFHFLGTFLAKALQDDRIVDLPLSIPFLKLLCTSHTNSANHTEEEAGIIPQTSTAAEIHLTSEVVTQNKERLTGLDESASQMNFSEDNSTLGFNGILKYEDFKLIYPAYASVTQELSQALRKQKRIIHDSNLSELEKTNEIQELKHSIESLCINFSYCPATSYGYDSYDLISDGENVTITLENAELYIATIQEFLLEKGIHHQLEAFKAGFNSVFPMSTLRCFQPEELRLVVCGELVPNWTREDLLNFTEAKNGYDKMSTAYLMFIDVAMKFTPTERKEFVQFVTGSSSLPPGGLANLRPRLCVVRKSTTYKGILPSVNTCFHYLKLPEYSTEEEMHLCLMAATKEKGFHLN